ncbi:MAG: membrane dipeptidase [Bdellovibrionales bacterium]|nr:membrane dipeptidase [Bdellovibrionales bacterium]
MNWLSRILLFITVLLSLFFLLAPFIIEHMQNGLEPDMVIVSDQAKQLHKNLFIADFHADSLLWKRDLTIKSSRGHVDLPRLQEGNVALQVFTIVTQSPRNLNIHSNAAASDNITLLAISQMWPVQTWTSLFERALYQAEKLRALEYDSGGKFLVITSRSQLVQFIEDRKSQKIIAGVLGLEGAHAVEKNLKADMEKLFNAGLRMMAPTHFFDNKIGGSAHGTLKGGLTKLGETFVLEANRLGIILDMAHASEQTIIDTLKLSKTPLVVSHTGLKGHCNNDRNLSDSLAREIASKGGIISIGFWSTAVCGKTVDAIADAIVYAVRTVGENSVALGSDFDGAVTVPFDASRLVWLTQKLIDRGLKARTIEKVMGLNEQAFLLANLP